MKIESLGREDFQNADYLAAQPDRCCQDGVDPQSAAALRVNPGIIVRIVAADNPTRAYTLSRKTTAHIQPGAKGRGISYAGPANHRSLVGERDGRTRAARKHACMLADGLQRGTRIGTVGLRQKVHRLPMLAHKTPFGGGFWASLRYGAG
jgi:hypothetical protein